MKLEARMYFLSSEFGLHGHTPLKSTPTRFTRCLWPEATTVPPKSPNGVSMASEILSCQPLTRKQSCPCTEQTLNKKPLDNKSAHHVADLYSTC